MRTKQTDTLCAGDLGVKLVIACDSRDFHQTFWRHFSARHTRDHGISAVFLHVTEEGIVGILQRCVCRFQHIFAPARGQNRADSWFTNFTAITVTVFA